MLLLSLFVYRRGFQIADVYMYMYFFFHNRLNTYFIKPFSPKILIRIVCVHLVDNNNLTSLSLFIRRSRIMCEVFDAR